VTAEAFVRGHTTVARTPLVPEIALHLATEITPIWQATEEWLRERNIEPPFWAFAWPGGQATARFLLDDPTRIAGRRVLDFAAGCGIAAIAAAQAGAVQVEAAEIDPLAAAAIRLNAALNGAAVTALEEDVVGQRNRWDTVLPAHSLSGSLALSHRKKRSDQNQPSHHYQRSGKHRTVHATPRSQTLRFTSVVVGGTDEQQLQTVHSGLTQGKRDASAGATSDRAPGTIRL